MSFRSGWAAVQEAAERIAEKRGSLRDRMITQTTLMGRAMTPVAPVANAVLDNKLARFAMEKVVGVHRDAPMPTARTQSLHGWLKKRPAPTRPATRGSVVYFHGCAGGFFEVEAAKKAIEVLEHLGFDDAAKKIHTAVEADIEELGSTVRSTDQVGKDILARM